MAHSLTEQQKESRRLAQKKYRARNGDLLREKARQRARYNRAALKEQPLHEQEAQLHAKRESARKYRERNRTELMMKARMRRVS
ncbi:hypothetical protein H0H93_012005 [Arthromyces matolae]|nr:hypothetical protein H0H93_012005 [Arthromyces matolae]